MKITKVSHSISYPFTVGSTPVKFEAETEEGVKKSCTVLIDVMGRLLFVYYFFVIVKSINI